MNMSSSDLETPVSDIFHQLSAEMQILMQAVLSIEEVVSELSGEPRLVSKKMLVGLQELDILRQTLCGLSQFLDVSAQEIPIEWTIDTRHGIEALRLGDLADRLVVPLARRERLDTNPSAGECMYF